MPARHALAATTLTLVVSASLLAGPASSSDTGTGTGTGTGPDTGPHEVAASTSVRVVGTQQIRLEALPQIVQQGRRVATADAAKAAIAADVKPIQPGRKVWLQVQRGGYWESVAMVREDTSGRAQFAAPAAEQGAPATYRVLAGQREGLPTMSSASVSTERWATPTWTDEFSGSSLSPMWHQRAQTYQSSILRTCSKGDPRAVAVRGGAVHLSVLRDPDLTTRCVARAKGTVVGKYPYRLNGHIGTLGSFSFKYGVAAARIRFQHLRGQHGAFWMQPLGGMYPGGGGHEVDVIEYMGHNSHRSALTTFIHRYVGDEVVKTGRRITDPHSVLKKRRDGWSKSFHVFSVVWTPETLIFRIDGKETLRIRGGVSNDEEYPILSLLSSDYEIPRISMKQLPQHMDVDWIRVWETGS